MIKYGRVRDDEEFDEDEIWDAVCEEVDGDLIEEVMSEFPLLTLFNRLDDDMKERIWDMAKDLCLEERFYEIDDDDEEDDE